MRLDSINFDDEQKMLELKQEMVEIPVGALSYLLNYFYTGGGEPDSHNERLAEAMEHGLRYEFTGHPGLPDQS